MYEPAKGQAVVEREEKGQSKDGNRVRVRPSIIGITQFWHIIEILAQHRHRHHHLWRFINLLRQNQPVEGVLTRAHCGTGRREGGGSGVKVEVLISTSECATQSTDFRITKPNIAFLIRAPRASLSRRAQKPMPQASQKHARIGIRSKGEGKCAWGWCTTADEMCRGSLSRTTVKIVGRRNNEGIACYSVIIVFSYLTLYAYIIWYYEYYMLNVEYKHQQ